MDVLMENDVTAAAKTPPPLPTPHKKNCFYLADHLTPTDLEKRGRNAISSWVLVPWIELQ